MVDLKKQLKEMTFKVNLLIQCVEDKGEMGLISSLGQGLRLEGVERSLGSCEQKGQSQLNRMKGKENVLGLGVGPQPMER